MVPGVGFPGSETVVSIAIAWLMKFSRSLTVDVAVTVKESDGRSLVPRVPASVSVSPTLTSAAGVPPVVTRSLSKVVPVGAVPPLVVNAWLVRIVAPLAKAPPEFRFPSSVTFFVAAASVSWPSGMVRLCKRRE